MKTRELSTAALAHPLSPLAAKHALKCPPKSCQRILVVEDEPDLRNLDTEVLRESGYKVDIAESGPAALGSLKTSCYDLLVIEDEMSLGTGLELVKKLRSEGNTVPVILVLGKLPTMDSSCDDWPQIQAIIIKPYTIAELVKTVVEVLRSSCRGSFFKFAPPSNWQSHVYNRWVADLRIHQ